MGYPLVNLGAWGPGVRPAGPVRPAVRVPFLGEGAARTVAAARKELEVAQEYLNKVLDWYPELAALVGEDKAGEAVGQARDGVEKARRAYGDAAAVAAP